MRPYPMFARLGGLALLLSLLLAACARPVARFNYALSGDSAPATVTFQNQSEKADAYEWHFGEGSRSTEANPQHRYYESGTYTITLTAMKEGKSRSTTQSIRVEAPEKCLVRIETPMGDMIAELYDATPQHRDNFLKLAEAGFYDSLLFHRVIDGFMVQGGDPDSRGAARGARLGMGGPGYTVPAEFNDELVHTKGALAAARMGDAANPTKASSGSQFYIVQGRVPTESQLQQLEAQKGIFYTKAQREAYLEKGGTPFLDREYTVFGQVIEGLEVIDKIATVSRDRADRPNDDVWMRISVIR